MVQLVVVQSILAHQAVDSFIEEFRRGGVRKIQVLHLAAILDPGHPLRVCLRHFALLRDGFGFMPQSEEEPLVLDVLTDSCEPSGKPVTFEPVPTQIPPRGELSSVPSSIDHEPFDSHFSGDVDLVQNPFARLLYHSAGGHERPFPGWSLRNHGPADVVVPGRHGGIQGPMEQSHVQFGRDDGLAGSDGAHRRPSVGAGTEGKAGVLVLHQVVFAVGQVLMVGELHGVVSGPSQSHEGQLAGDFVA